MHVCWTAFDYPNLFIFYASEKRDIITWKLIFAVCMTMLSGYLLISIWISTRKTFFTLARVCSCKQKFRLVFLITILFGVEQKMAQQIREKFIIMFIKVTSLEQMLGELLIWCNCWGLWVFLVICWLRFWCINQKI